MFFFYILFLQEGSRYLISRNLKLNNIIKHINANEYKRQEGSSSNLTFKSLFKYIVSTFKRILVSLVKFCLSVVVYIYFLVYLQVTTYIKQIM